MMWALPLLLAFDGPTTLSASSPAEPLPIVGGDFVDACAWPSAARSNVSGVGCGAALIHPQVVVLTDFCLDFAGVSPDTDGAFGLQFGYWGGSSLSYEVEAPFSGCHFDDAFGVCVLDEPLPIPYAPPAAGCETELLRPDAEVVFAGFGDIGFEDNRDKRAGVVTVTEVRESLFTAVGEAGPCAGDSGDATFTRMSDGSWRTVGIAAGQECDSLANFFNVTSRVPWIEDVTGIDVTPCHDADGAPDPGPDCGGFFAGDADNFGSWSQLCTDAFLGGDGGVCSGDEQPPTATLDSPGDGTVFPDIPSEVRVEASASDGDGVGVRDVRISINGDIQPIERRDPPYAFELDLPEGTWTLAVIARDWSGNEASSDPIVVHVGDGPTPPEGDTSTGADDEDPMTTTGEAPGTSGEPEDSSPGEESSGGDSSSAEDDLAGAGCRVGGRWNPGSGLLLLALGGWLRPRRRRATGPGAPGSRAV